MRKWLTVLMLLLSIGLAAIVVKVRMDADREGPKIVFSKNKERTYTEGEDTYELLKGVKAKDAVDGNVSDTLTVESVYPKKDGKEVVVVYAAKDKSNNVTKAEFTMKVDYTAGADAESNTDTELNTNANADPNADATARLTEGGESGTDSVPGITNAPDAAADGAEGLNANVNTGTGAEPVAGEQALTPTPAV